MDIEAQETNNKELLNMEKKAPNYCQAIKKEWKTLSSMWERKPNWRTNYLWLL